MESNKTLKNLSFKRRYDPCKDGTDVINEIYIPCLSNSIRYDRIAAYFNSAVLQLYAAGLNELAKNNGHARYIFSCETDEIDLQKITDAYNEKMNSLADDLGDDLADDYNIANLSYLVKHDIVEIKIAFMLTGKASIMHVKQGIFEDQYGYKVSFSGSGNETPSGLQENCENFKVFTNFDGPDEYLNDDELVFDEMWNNTYSPGKVYAATPTGLFFEKLCSYNRNRLFESQKEFDEFVYDGKLFVDIDVDSSSIFVIDYTKDKPIRYINGITATFGSRLSEPEPNSYIISDFTLADLRDKLPTLASKFGVELAYSQKAQAYLNEQNLNIDKRIKLGISIKQRNYEDGWADDYERYKNIVNFETKIPLKEDQLLNGFHHLMMKSSMDFSVPGSGKTYISYGLFAYLASSYDKIPQVNSIAIFGPLACFKAWKDECVALFGDKFNGSIFDSSEYSGSEMVRELKKNKYRIYLINYESFGSLDISNSAIENIVDEKTMVVFDEIHRIKKVGGTRASNILNAFKSLKHKPIYKLALTGTPIPNSFVDLSNCLHLLYQDDINGYLSSLSDYNLKLADKNTAKADEIKEALYPLYTRTTKQDLGITPANDDDIVTLRVNVSEDEDALYDYVYKAYQSENPLVRFLRLIQASSNPKLLLDAIDKDELKSVSDDDFDFDGNLNLNKSLLYTDEIKDLVSKIGISTKTRRAIDLVEQSVHNGKKLVVWCLFISTINEVYQDLTRRNINAVTISGIDPLPERNDKIECFKNGNIDVIITNPNTLAESVSLHTVCHDAAYIEYGFNLTYMLQSKDRIHRVGLPKGTETNYFYAISDSKSGAGGIDNHIYERLKYKEERMKKAIESNDLVFVPDENDIDDIRFILGEMDRTV